MTSDDRVITERVPVPTTAGSMDMLIARPHDGHPRPLVIFLMDAHGRRPELDRMAERLAAAGYCVAQPDLYYRDDPMFTLDISNQASLDRVQQLIAATTTANVRADIAAVIGWADASGLTSGVAVGCVGYCFAGPFAIDAAKSYPDRIVAAASIHGVRLHTDAPDSPHLDLAAVRGELYVGAAEHDAYAPREMVDRLARSLTESGVTHRVEWYPGTKHGFAFPERDAYDEAAAQRHWDRLLDLFGRTLRDTP